MASKYDNYVKDLVILLKERAEEAVLQAEASPGDDFASGRALAYGEVLDLVANQGEAFRISRSDLGLADFELVAFLTRFRR
ncbi:transposase [Myxococcota bacterium]|nr:transposase [Myxococcota bacterium]